MKGIYKITSPSGRIYIGQSDNIEARFNLYRKLYCKKQPRLFYSLKKYGCENHKFEILTTLPDETDKEYMDFWEELYIQQAKSNCSRYPNDNGMNLTDGGYGKAGYKWSEESKLKARNSGLGRRHSKDSKEKIRKSRIGKFLSIETKQKISGIKKGEKRTEEHKLKLKQLYSKSVQQYTIDGTFLYEWNSARDASKNLGISAGNISQCSTGKRKTASGFKWKFK